MGQLINGEWQYDAVATNNKSGDFVRLDSEFRHQITADGSSGFKAEPDRYHLYISYACPWACRTLIFRKLKGLDKAISFSVVEPIMRKEGWEFSAAGGDYIDPLYGFSYLRDIYLKADLNCNGKVTVPVLWDKQTQTIVNNESSEIIRMLNSEFNEFAKHADLDFYPAALRDDIDAVNTMVYDGINNGVYRCGFAKSQPAYDKAYDQLFAALDDVEQRLAKTRYLLGDQLTEADWRLFVTLIRFDPVYVGHFKCNKQRIEDYPNLSDYVRDLYQYPGIKETVNFAHIKQHYYASHPDVNPFGIVPKGPEIDFDKAHNRADM